MMSLGSSRLGKRYIPVLKRSYRRAKKEGDFRQACTVGNDIGEFGRHNDCSRYLIRGFSSRLSAN